MAILVFTFWQIVAGSPLQAGATEPDEPPALPGEFVDGQVVVELAEDADIQELEDAIADLPLTVTESIPEGDVSSEVVLLEASPDLDVAEALATLEEEACVQNAQPNRIYHVYGDDDGQPAGAGHAAQVPDDPEAAQTGGQGQMLQAINAYEAWGLAKAEGTVTIAVLDSGCDLAHPDLAANIIAKAAYSVVGDADDLADRSDHGTHVAGIAAAVAGNGQGVAGVSYNARILPVKAVDDTGKITTFNACKGMRYIAEVIDAHPEYNIRVLNMSFGGKVESADSDDQATVHAIENLHAKGVLPVCAAGNADATRDEVPPYLSWPGDFSEDILSVVNADGDGRASGSNFNLPGQVLKAVCAPGTGIYSTVPGGDYGRKSGTSMAAPCVSGVAALAFAANPALQPSDVAAILCSTARDLGPEGFDGETGFGMVDAAGAVRAAVSGAYLQGPRSVAVDGTTQLAPAWQEDAGLAWSSSNPDVAAVDAAGTVTGISEGTAIITAQAGDIALSAAMTVHDPSISGTDTLKEGEYATWKAASGLPAVWNWASSDESVATVGDTGKVRAVGAGHATITASLSSNPAISASAEIAVSAAADDISSAQVTLEEHVPYTGSVQTPRPTVVMGDTTLRFGADYKLSYKNNRDPGTATVTITGMGAYRGSLNRAFVIDKADNPLKVKASKKTAKASKLKKAAVKVSPISATGAKGALTFAKASGSKALSVNKKTGKVTVKKGTKKGSYKIRVKVQAKGDACYLPKSTTVTVTVKVK